VYSTVYDDTSPAINYMSPGWTTGQGNLTLFHNETVQYTTGLGDLMRLEQVVWS
jgi:hypothetical protein